MSDYIIDIVPYGGRKGGEVTFVGTVSDMIANSNCITAKFLRDSIVVIQKGKDNIMKEQELWQAYTHENLPTKMNNMKRGVMEAMIPICYCS